MKSRNRRLRRTLLSFSLFPLIVRLVVVLFFVFMLLEGTIFVRGLSDGQPMTKLPDGSVDFRFPLSGFMQGRLAVIGLLGLLALVSLINGIVAIYSEHRRRTEVEINSVQSYLEANRFKRRRFVLMLRPFEQDGFLFLPEKKPFWRGLLFPAIQTSTIEQIFERLVRGFRDVDVISVADPYKDELVPGPTYLMTGENWQADVQKLIGSADAIVFVIPQLAGMTPGLEWEIDAAYRISGSQNAAVVLPPKRQKTKATLEILQRFIESSRMTLPEDVPPDRIFFLDLGSKHEFWYEYRRPWPPWPQRSHSDIYQKASASWLDQHLRRRQ